MRFEDQPDPLMAVHHEWRLRWSGADSMTAALSIARAEQLVAARLNAALRPFDLTMGRYETLLLLAVSETGQLPLGRMSELMMVHPTSITNNIDRLEAQGYVRRMPHESDRRTTLAEITSSGREIVDIASHELQKIDFGLDALSPRERVQLSRILRKVRTDGNDVGLG
ncbi:MAG TPA: MarR family transcriptional regulator [Acidimicrobiia bacterium]|nr:MarR family transcriptional regulator [Acidimicrobiia bacterium]